MAEREHDGTGATRERRYPLGEGGGEGVTSRTGVPLGALTLDAVRAGQLRGEDFTIHPDTLRQQASFAEEAGYPQLAANLRRAAELATLPDDRVLAIYEALRPYRLGYEQLLALAHELASEHGAPETARYVREAAEAYRRRGLG